MNRVKDLLLVIYVFSGFFLLLAPLSSAWITGLLLLGLAVPIITMIATFRNNTKEMAMSMLLPSYLYIFILEIVTNKFILTGQRIGSLFSNFKFSPSITQFAIGAVILFALMTLVAAFQINRIFPLISVISKHFEDALPLRELALSSQLENNKVSLEESEKTTQEYQKANLYFSRLKDTTHYLTKLVPIWFSIPIASLVLGITIEMLLHGKGFEMAILQHSGAILISGFISLFLILFIYVSNLILILKSRKLLKSVGGQ
ncbi:MAG: hypothetical protein WCT14_03500 [Treponemataceae bacterium]